MPRRRWVGSTEMAVRPPIGMVVSPGRVRSIEKAPPVPTMRSPSKAPMLRSYSNHRSWSASSSSVNVSPNAVARTPLNWSPWSGVIGRMSMSMGPLYWKRPGRTPPFRPVSSATHGADPRKRPGPGRPASGVGLVPGRSLGAGRAVRAERPCHRPAGAGRDGQEPRLLPLPPGRPARHPSAGRRRDGAAGARHLDGGGAGRARHGHARRPLHLVAVTGLLTLLAVEAVKKTTDLRGPRLAAIASAAGLLGGVLYVSRSWPRLWLRYLTPAPLVFALLFLLVSPTSALVLPAHA